MESLIRRIPWINPQSRRRIKAVSGSANSSFFFGRTQWSGGMALITVAIHRRSSSVWVLNLGYSGAFDFGVVTAIVIENRMIYFWFDSRTVCVRLYIRTSVQSKALTTWVKSGRKVSEESTKPLGFTMPHYFYMHNISLDDFGAIQTARGGIYIFTTGTPYKITRCPG